MLALAYLMNGVSVIAFDLEMKGYEVVTEISCFSEKTSRSDSYYSMTTSSSSKLNEGVKALLVTFFCDSIRVLSLY